MKKIQLTMLNAMGNSDFSLALETHKEWGLKVLDLKDSIFGKSFIDLNPREAQQAKALIETHGLSVYCLSSVLFYEEVEIGEAEFRQRSVDHVERLLTVAQVLKPQVIRLLAAKSTQRARHTNIVPYLKKEHPWLISLYRQAIDRIHAAGFGVTIENEAHACIFSNPTEILDFFHELDRPQTASFTYDIQNLWQMGTFPTVESYHQLAGLTRYFHVKGGRADGGTALVWRSPLEDASWPVKEIVRLAIDDGISPVFCLNPSHGKSPEGYDHGGVTKKDIDFLRKTFPEIE